MNKTPERFLWAADVLNLDPSDNILEIGCGAGLLAEQIAGRLKTGTLIGVDQSSFMIVKAKKRNDAYIRSGTSRFIHSEFGNTVLPSGFFNGIIAFNVNFFRKGDSQELEIIKRILKKNGKLFVFYQDPYETQIKSDNSIKKNLIKHSFLVADIIYKKFKPASAFCITATLSSNP